MSIPLKDVGSVKLSERDHSYLKAKATLNEVDVTTLIRKIVHDHISRELDVLRLADTLHDAKGLGEILKDNEQ